MIDTDFEQLNLKDMIQGAKEGRARTLQLKQMTWPEIRDSHPKIAESVAYLEKRDNVLTELEAWLSHKLAHENKTINSATDIEMRLAAGHRGLAIYDVIKKIEKLNQVYLNQTK